MQPKYKRKYLDSLWYILTYNLTNNPISIENKETFFLLLNIRFHFAAVYVTCIYMTLLLAVISMSIHLYVSVFMNMI